MTLIVSRYSELEHVVRSQLILLCTFNEKLKNKNYWTGNLEFTVGK